MKSKSIILIAVSLGFGLIAAVGMSQVMGRNRGPAVVKVKEVQVVYTTADIQIGEELNTERVQLKSIPEQYVQEGQVLSLDEIKDTVAVATMIKGQPVMRQAILNAIQYRSKDVPAGFEVYTIKADERNTFFGELKPGDYVDISGIFRHPDTEEPISLTFLRSIKIYGIDDKNDRDPNAQGGGKQRVIKILVLPGQKQVYQLAESMTGGKIGMSLKNREEAELEIEKMKKEGSWEDFMANKPISSQEIFKLAGITTGKGTKPTPAKASELAAMFAGVASRVNSASQKPATMQVVTDRDIVQYSFVPGSLPSKTTLDLGGSSGSKSSNNLQNTGLPIGASMVDQPAEADSDRSAEAADLDGSDDSSDSSDGKGNSDAASDNKIPESA